jgi:hypothetical protein
MKGALLFIRKDLGRFRAALQLHFIASNGSGSSDALSGRFTIDLQRPRELVY